MVAFNLPVTTIATGILDKVDRNPLLLARAASMSACLFVLPVIEYMVWPVEAVFMILLCCNVFFGFSEGTVVWANLGEILPPEPCPGLGLPGYRALGGQFHRVFPSIREEPGGKHLRASLLIWPYSAL
jgi:hypothetical protein